MNPVSVVMELNGLHCDVRVESVLVEHDCATSEMRAWHAACLSFLSGSKWHGVARSGTEWHGVARSGSEWLGVARQRFLENATSVVDDIMGATVQFAQGGLYSTHSQRN